MTTTAQQCAWVSASLFARAATSRLFQIVQPPSRSAGSRQAAKVAKTNKFDVFACGETTSEKLGVLGVLAVKNAAYVVL
ncbi:MAG: hypothetical protein WCR06_05950, partial [bacterium]